MTTMKTWAALVAAGLVSGPGAPPARATCEAPPEARVGIRASLDAGAFADVMTRGKLEADLGNHATACAAFAALAAADGAPDALRWEALVREAVVRRRMGDPDGSVAAFEAVASRYAEDAEALRFLAEALTGVKPGREYWSHAWKDVRFERIATAAGPPRLEPRFPSEAPGDTGPFTGEPISVNLEDADLVDLMRLFSEMSGLEIVLDPSVTGRTLSMALDEVPWDQAFAMVLRTQGLIAQRTDSGYRIVRRYPEAVMRADDTMGRLRSIALCFLARRQDHGSYPLAAQWTEVSALARHFAPTYIRELPLVDGWGGSFRCWSSGDAFVVVSAGADGVVDATLEASRWIADGCRAGDDLYATSPPAGSDRAFATCPRERAPAR
jgi:hypothetical protein